MSKDFYSKDLDAVLTVPDDWTDEQVWAYEDSLRPTALKQIGGAFSGVLPGIIKSAARNVEGAGGLTDSDTLKSIAAKMRDNPVSSYLIERPQELDNTGRDVGELAGDIAFQLVPGLAARAVGAGAKIARGLSALGSMAGMAGEATQEVERNRAEGMQVSPEHAQAAAWAAAPLGLADLIPLGRYIPDDIIGRKLAQTGTAKLAARAAGTGVLEGATEGLQTAGVNLGERLIYNPNQGVGEGVIPSAEVGAGAGALIDFALSAAGRRVARKGLANIRRSQGESPELNQLDRESVGIRRTEAGDADVQYLPTQDPNWLRSHMPFLETASQSIYGVPISQLDAGVAIDLDRKIEQLRNVAQIPDKDIIDVLQSINTDGPKPSPTMPRNLIDSLMSGPDQPLQYVPYLSPGPAPIGDTPAPPPYSVDLGTLPQELPMYREYRPRVETEGMTPGKQMPKRPLDLRLTDEGTFELPSLFTPVTREQLASYRSEVEADRKRMDDQFMRKQFIEDPLENITVERKQPSVKPYIGRVETEGITPDKPIPSKLPELRMTDEGTFVEPKRTLFSLDGGDKNTYTIDGLRQEIDAGTKPQIALDLFEDLKKKGVDDLVSTQLVDTITTPEGVSSTPAGYFKNNIITLALAGRDADSLRSTLHHETVHALKQAGLFTDAEWSTLQAALRPEVTMTPAERREYNVAYQGDKALIAEEAVAKGMQRYYTGDYKPSSSVASILKEKFGILDSVRTVMEKTQSGEIGSRPLPYDLNAIPDTPALSMSPQDEADFKETFGSPDRRGLLTKTKEAVQQYRQAKGIDNFFSRVRQQGLDRRAGIEKLSREAGSKTDESAIVATRFADLAGNLAAASFVNGPVVMEGTADSGHFRASGKGGVFRGDGPLAKLAEKGDDKKLYLAMDALRTERLFNQGRLKNIDPKKIARNKAYMKDPLIVQAADELNQHFNASIDIMEKSGMLSQDAAEKMRDSNYFPFYRQMVDVDENGNLVARDPEGFESIIVKSPSVNSAALTDIKQLRKLKGSDARKADPVQNITRNTFALTSAAMRNVAARRVMREGLQLGYVKQTTAKDPKKQTVWVDGKPQYYRVLDPLLHDSILAAGIQGGAMLDFSALPSKWLRESVTLSPMFMIRNGLRDATQVWAQGYTTLPFQKIIPSLRDTATRQMLDNYGVTGTGIRGEGIDDTAAKLEANLKRPGMLKRIGKLRDTSEAIGRVTVANAVKSRGGSDLQAAYEALELLNFNRKGSSPIAQIVSALIPFLNARAQGIDVLYRTTKGQGQTSSRQLLLRSMYLTGLTALYTFLSMGKDYYENALPEERDNYWFIDVGLEEPIRIPTPFELGILSKTLPERLINLAFGSDTLGDTSKSVKRAISSTLELNLPQAVKPPMEAYYANYDTFRQRPVVPMAKERLEKPMQYDDYTSEISKAIGSAANMSPMQIDHIIKGYTGSLGVMALSGVDALLKEGVRPEIREPHTIPIVGGLFQRKDGGRMLVDYYELRTLAEKAAATQKEMAKQGIRDGKERDRAQKAALVKALDPIDDRLSDLRKMKDAVEKSNQISASQKRDALNLIRQREIQATRVAQRFRE